VDGWLRFRFLDVLLYSLVEDVLVRSSEGRPDRTEANIKVVVNFDGQGHQV
jgi:hypothetical protein